MSGLMTHRGTGRSTRRGLVAAVLAPVLVLLTPAGPAGATPTCHGKPATIVGTPGDDWLYGTDGPDVILGLGGGVLSMAFVATTPSAVTTCSSVGLATTGFATPAGEDS